MIMADSNDASLSDGSSSHADASDGDQAADNPYGMEDVIENPKDEDDEEDNRAFRGWSRNGYDYIVGMIREIGQPWGARSFGSQYMSSRDASGADTFVGISYEDKAVDSIDLGKVNREFEEPLDEVIVARIGKRCYDSKTIRYLKLGLCSLTEGVMRSFFHHWSGGSTNIPLIGLDLTAPGYDRDQERRYGLPDPGDIIGRVLNGNSTLIELHLNRSLQNIGVGGSRSLAEALSKTSSPLAHIGLEGSELSDEEAEPLSTAIGGIATIQTVNLCENNIQHYHSISAIVGDGASCKVTLLNLYKNKLDDKFAVNFAAGIANNTTLSGVPMGENFDISDAGWEAITSAVLNPLSISTLSSSNSCLKYVGWPKGRYSKPLPNMCTDAFGRLRKVLRINGSSELSDLDKTRRKIFLRHFDHQSSSPLCDEVLQLRVEFMPRLLSMIGTKNDCHPSDWYGLYSECDRNGHQEWLPVKPRLASLRMHYRLVRSIPTICSIPSAKEVSLSKIVDELRERLKAKDELIDEMRRELRELKLGTCDDESKRQRLD